MVEVAGFNQLLQNLAQLDFFTLLLPFLLTFVLFFFLLKQLPLWGNLDDGMDQRLAGIVSIIIAFFVAFFLSQNPAYQNFFTGYFARLTIAMVGMLGLLIILAFAGLNVSTGIPLVIIVSVLAIVSAFSASGGLAPFLPEGTLPLLDLSYEDLKDLLFDTGLVYMLIIGGAIWWLVSYKEEEDTSSDSLIRNLVESLD